MKKFRQLSEQLDVSSEHGPNAGRFVTGAAKKPIKTMVQATPRQEVSMESAPEAGDDINNQSSPALVRKNGKVKSAEDLATAEMGGTMSRYMPEEKIEEIVAPDLKQDLTGLDSSSFKKKHGKSKIEAHKYVSEARMTAAMKLQKAFQREQEKTASDRKAGEDLLKKPEPVKEGNGYDDNRRGFGKPPREDDEYHVPDPTVKKLKKEEVEQLEEGRPSQRHPLEGHEYHKKTNAELEYIAKDAHKAAEAMKSHNTTAENKYRDQASDSATVRYFRKKNGMPEWYKKKYGHVNEEVMAEQKPPFDGPYKKSPKVVTDKSGAEHTPMSRARDLARDAMKKVASLPKKKLNESRKAEIVKQASKDAKKKSKEKKSDDTFQAEPTLDSQVIKTD